MHPSIERLAATPLGPRGVYEALCEHVYLPLLDWRGRTSFTTALQQARRNQYASRDELNALVLRKLRHVVSLAAKSCPFYAERYRGLAPDSLDSIEDLQRFPRVTKADVFEHGREMDNTNYVGRVIKGVSSGSTGMALTVRQGGEHQGWIDACWERGISWWDLKRGDRRIVLWGRPAASGAHVQAASWLKLRLRNGLWFNTSEGSSEEFLERVRIALETFRPRFIFGYGSSLGPVAEYIERTSPLREDARPRAIFYGGDHIYEAERQTCERVIAPVAPVYGATEAGSMAYSCAKGSLHISEDHIHVEFLREDGTAAEPGELAEIAVTTLNNFAMPLIRYRLGDLGSYRNDTCACGVTLKTMNLEVGKVADLVTTSTKHRVSPYALDQINKFLLRQGIHGIRQFLVEQTALDDFILHVVREEPFDERSTSTFVDKMRGYFGESIRVEVRFVDSIPISKSGKRRWFLSSIEKK